MVMHFVMLIMGILIFAFASHQLFHTIRGRYISLIDITKISGAFLLASLILITTLPSLKNILQDNYELIKGECVVEIVSSSRSSTETNIKMLDTNESYIFDDIPALKAFGKKSPYYCSVLITSDHMWNMGFSI